MAVPFDVFGRCDRRESGSAPVGPDEVRTWSSQEVPTGEEDEDEIYSQRSKLCADRLLRCELFGIRERERERAKSSEIGIGSLMEFVLGRGLGFGRYRFKDGEWKERGLGDSKLLRHRVRGTKGGR